MNDLTVTRISNQVYQIDASLPGSAGTVAVYVLKGSKIAIVDCGYASTYKTILQGLNEIGIQPSEVNYLIPTHLHLDHSGGTGHLLHHTPNAQVIAHERGVPHFIDPFILIKSVTSIFGPEIMRIYGKPISVEKNRIVPVRRELHLNLGQGLSVIAIETPGHAPHQISLFVEEPKLLLSADAVGSTLPKIPTMIPTTPPPSFDPSKLADTIDNLLQLDSRELLVPHYGVRKDARDVLQETKTKTEEWICGVKASEKEGLCLDEIVERFLSRLMKETGLRRQDLDTFTRLVVRVSIMGILTFLDKIPQSSNVSIQPKRSHRRAFVKERTGVSKKF